MNSRLKRLLHPLTGEDVLSEIEKLLMDRYFEDWRVSQDLGERETIFVKTQVVAEMLMEFSSMINENRETEDGG